jgi:hypothetical protein
MTNAAPNLRKIVKVLEVIDTREYIEDGDRFRPVAGSGVEHVCERCGRSHEVHAHVLLDDGREAVVGVSCAKREDAEIVKRLQSYDRAAKRLARLRAELVAAKAEAALYEEADRKARALPKPPVTFKVHVGQHGEDAGKEWGEWNMGDAYVWDLSSNKGGDLGEARRYQLEESWIDKRRAEFLGKPYAFRPVKAGYIEKDIRALEERLARLND